MVASILCMLWDEGRAGQRQSGSAKTSNAVNDTRAGDHGRFALFRPTACVDARCWKMAMRGDLGTR